MHRGWVSNRGKPVASFESESRGSCMFSKHQEESHIHRHSAHKQTHTIKEFSKTVCTDVQYY